VAREDASRANETITDGRGRRVAPLDPVALQLMHRHDVIDADALREIRREVGSGLEGKSRRTVRVLGVIWGLCVLVLAIRVIELALQGNFRQILDPKMITFINLWFFATMIWATARRRRLGRVKRVMLAHARCPHCGYDIKGLPTEQDGLTLCPECGCAWSLPAS
jgi:hypothetical protein